MFAATSIDAFDQRTPVATGSLWFEMLLAALVALTVIVVATGGHLLQTVRVLDAEGGYPVALRDDASTGGNSSVEALVGTGYQWRCTLGAAYQYHFCAHEILLDAQRRNGLDLERYDSIRLWLDYQGSGRTVRIFLRNFDPRYSVAEDPISTKFNQIEVPVTMLEDGMVDFPLSDFQVANWWMHAYEIPPGLGRPQLDNVVSIEVQTGSGQSPGDHHFRLDRIELVGQIFPTEQLYLGILGGWLCLIVAFIVNRILALKREIGTRRQREVELLEINALLDSRSKLMEHRARTDALTGAFNRRGVEDAILRGLAEWRSHGKPLSLLILDVDHFKQVNDVHGHAAGDRVLSQLAALVQANIRGNDLFARWGGEEFVLLCRNSANPQAVAFAEKLRALVAGQDFGNGLRVTVSFGVATLSQDEPLDRLFAAADAALYLAKGAGRNRVISAPHENGEPVTG
jgi:diguanylate cyclase (GGDEF)-like protein